MPKLTRLPSNGIARGHPSLKFPGKVNVMSTFHAGVRVDLTTHLGPQGTPLDPKNGPKYAQTNQIYLCPCLNSIVRGHPSLKSPRECLCHVCLSSRCTGRPHHTFGAKGPASGPKNQPKYSQANQICLCPCSIIYFSGQNVKIFLFCCKKVLSASES